MKEELELKKDVIEKVYDFRRKFNIKDEPIKDIYSLAFAREFIVLRFPFNQGISGAYIEKKGRGDKIYRCIYINNREPIGRLAFSFMHEIYHAYYERSGDSVISYNQSRNPIEKKANKFASYILIPRPYLRKIIMEMKGTKKNWNIKIEEIFDLQYMFGVSFLAVVKAIDEFRDTIKPRNIKMFYKYKNKKYWDELEKLTLNYDKNNFLNSCNPRVEWPDGLKENIEKNIKDGIILREDVEGLISFFEE